MEHAEDHHPVAVVPILEDIRGAQHLQDDLSVFFARRDRPPQLRMPSEELYPRDDFLGHDRRKLGGLFVQERGESIEVGEGLVRPFQAY